MFATDAHDPALGPIATNSLTLSVCMDVLTVLEISIEADLSSFGGVDGIDKTNLKDVTRRFSFCPGSEPLVPTVGPLVKVSPSFCFCRFNRLPS